MLKIIHSPKPNPPRVSSIPPTFRMKHLHPDRALAIRNSQSYFEWLFECLGQSQVAMYGQLNSNRKTLRVFNPAILPDERRVQPLWIKHSPYPTRCIVAIDDEDVCRAYLVRTPLGKMVFVTSKQTGRIVRFAWFSTTFLDAVDKEHHHSLELFFSKRLIALSTLWSNLSQLATSEVVPSGYLLGKLLAEGFTNHLDAEIRSKIKSTPEGNILLHHRTGQLVLTRTKDNHVRVQNDTKHFTIASAITPNHLIALILDKANNQWKRTT